MSQTDSFNRDDAILLLEQARYLLDDERSFADKLVADRKIKLSIASLIAGLLLLKTEMIQQSWDAAFKINGIVGCVLVILGLVVAGLTIWALYVVATDSNHQLINKCLSWVARHRSDSASADSDGDEDLDDDDGAASIDPKEIFSRACVELFPDADHVDSLDADQIGHVAYRIIDFQNAYIALANANKRVHDRLEFGTMTLFLALLSAIILSILSIGLTSIAGVQSISDAQFAKECWHESHNSIQVAGVGSKTLDVEAAQVVETAEFTAQGNEAKAKE